MSIISPASYTSFQSLLGGLALLSLILCVAVRSAVLRRRGIRAMLFGKTDKSDFLLILGLLAIVYSVTARSLGLPMWGPLLKPFWEAAVPGWIGLAFCVFAVIGMILTLASFGDSFRVGIDVETPSSLVTDGMFGISRNPIYLSMLTMLIGQFLIHRNIVITAVTIFFAVIIHRQILREEKFLKENYGEEYAAYCLKVRRYI